MTRTPLHRALDALDGLSVGDAFGERFFGDPQEMRRMARERQDPEGDWPWTDDTLLSLCVVAVLERHGRVEQAQLASLFGAAYRHDPARGFGAGMHRLLPRYQSGDEWRSLATEQFGGRGSFGNGAAMRVAPLGAYFAGDAGAAAREATASAEVTHSHPEGIAGAVAVAVASSVAAEGRPLAAGELLQVAAGLTPESAVRRGLRTALALEPGADPLHAAALLGNGSGVTAQDTVPFCLWSASRRPDDFAGALWDTALALGDSDTTCAIVGGILGGRLTSEAIPGAWMRRREGLPPWVARVRRAQEGG